MIQYEDFSIKIEPQREDVYPVIVLRSPAGEGRSSFRLPFAPDDLGDLLVDLGQTIRGTSQRPMREAAPGATRTRPQQIGDQLFNALFAGPVRSLLDQSLGMIRERQKGLRIKLHIDPEDASLARLASLPWELMYRKETRDFLNLSRYTPILRYLDVQVPYVPLKLEPPLRILVVISDPVDYARLDLEHERDQIERTWARQENVEVSFLETPTIAALQERLEREPFHALHYMGHGGFDRHSGSGVLLLEDESRCGIPVDGRTLGVLLHDVPSLRLVFLNACETARVTKQADLDPFAGAAAAIVMAGVPAVVAMQFPISDVAAIRFAGRFYPLIALGEPVDYAVAEGRRAIRVAESDTMEWATPILFMRAPDGVLFRVAEAHRVQRRRPQPPILDKELEQRLEGLYIAGLSAFWLEEWDRACHSFQEIVDEQPDYKDAAAKLQEAERKWHQNELYSQAQEARRAGSWTAVLVRLEELVAEEPGYKDAASLLEEARRQRRLADLYAQARQLHGAGQWPAVLRVFDQIAALDPDYPDPDDLLTTARREAAELERQAELNELYRRAVLEMEAGHWEEARECLSRLQDREPGYQQADRLLAKAQAEIFRLEEEHQRQEQIAALYDRAVNRAGAGQWAQALAAMDKIHALDPAFDDPQGLADRARTELERQRKLEALYDQARAARETQDWAGALAALQALVGEDASYRDAAALLTKVKVQQELAGLYARARQQHRAGEWSAVVETFARMAALEPGYADPEGLLPAAERSLAEQQRRAELDDLYNRAEQALEASDWALARQLLAQIREREPDYREAERLLERAGAELEQAEAERQRREQIATLYEQAQSLARARQWRQALAKMDEIYTLDAGFADPEGIAARARERVAQEEAEARRQNELAALYAEAVRLLKAEQYQEALQKWGEVQALDPRYPDRKKVQAMARKKLTRLVKPAAKRRLPRWAGIAAGALMVVAVLVAAVLIRGVLSAAPPTPGRIPTDLGRGAVWEWSDGSAMVYVPASAFYMGSSEIDPSANADEWPQHLVYLDTFWIDRTEVTNGQYRRCVEDGGCSPPSETASYTRESYYGNPEFDDYPVIYVDWQQANAYCAWADKRLPTEAEWEKAARGTDRRIYPWGEGIDCKRANYDGCVGGTSKVGTHPLGASPYGALDMAGNVFEWTSSLYKPYPYEGEDGREDLGADGQRVRRGGSWNYTPGSIRAASRDFDEPVNVQFDVGFRCMRSASGPAQASSAQRDTTPTPLPGTEVIPIGQMAPSIPWLPYDESTIPAALHYAFNLSKPPFDDVLVRQAFALAMHRGIAANTRHSRGFLGLWQPGGHEIQQFLLGFQGQAQVPYVGLECGEGAISPKVAVDARGGRRIDKLVVLRIDGAELAQQSRNLLEPKLLVVGLGQVELDEGHDLGIDRASAAGGFAVPTRFRQPFLLLVMVENNGGILPRPGPGSGAVTAPKDVQQFLVRDLGWVVIDLDRLAVIAQVMIGRVGLASARVSHAGADNAREAPELGVRSPESAQGKGRRFGFGRCGRIQWWDSWPGCRSGRGGSLRVRLLG